MSLFGNVVGTLIGTANKESSVSLEKGVAQFKGKLNSQEKIRFFVEGSNGSGHQTTSVHIMFRLIFGFEYFKAIEVYYEEREGADKPTKDKLINLIPGLTNDNFNIGIKIGPGPGDDKKATITFIKFDKDTPPVNKVTCGFTGGNDLEGNFAKKLNADYFLRLQPLDWKNTPNEIEFLDEARENVVLYEIKNKTYFYGISNLAAEDWEPMKASAAGLNKRRIELAEILFTKLTANDIFIMPVYGIRDDGKMQIGDKNNPEIFMFSLLAPLLSLLKENEHFFQDKKVVLVSFGELTESTFDKIKLGCIELLQKWKTEQEKARDESTRPSQRTFKRWCNRKVNVYIGAIELIQALSLNLEALFVKEGTTIETLSTLINNNPKKVLYLQLGGVPSLAFDYFYSKANLPTVFEGQGTAAKAACYGIPYLQLGRFGNTDKYPKELDGVGNDGFNNFHNSVEAVLNSFPTEGKLDDFVTSFNGNEPNLVEQCKNYSKNKVNIISDLIKDSLPNAPINKVKQYMALLKNQLGSEEQDKLLLAIIKLNEQLPAQEVPHIESYLSINNLAALQQTPLEALLNRLNGCISPDKSLRLLDALSSGRMKDFYTKIIVDSNLLINNASVTPVYNSNNVLTKIAVAGNTECFGLSMKINSLDFTETPTGLMSHAEFICLQANSTWVLDGVPWIVLENPGFNIDAFDPPVPASGKIFGTLKSPSVKLSVGFPICTQWIIKGQIEKPYPNISTACQLLGGIDITQSLPSPLNTLAGLGISEIEVTYNQINKNISSLKVVIEPNNETKWELLPGTYVNEFKIELSILNPGSLNNRQIEISVCGNVIISKGTIGIYITYPNFSVFGNLYSGEIILSDLLNAFAPSSQVDLQSKVTQFGFSVEPKFSSYSLSGTLETKWPITISEKTIFELDNLQLQIQNSNDQKFAMIGAVTTLFPNKQNEIILSISTSWQSKDQNIIFEGKQTSGVVPLVDLLTFYLSNDWKPDVSYDIDGLGLTIETKTKSWKFTGKTAQPWKVPFIPELTVSASLTAGYKGKTLQLALSDSTMELIDFEQSVQGYFARLETDWKWESIDIKVWFDYNPQVKTFGFTWGLLSTEIEKDTKGEWIGTLKLTEGFTIGSMVEEMVSWITGSRFSLGSPWNILDSISLSGLELVYNFTQKKVSFKVNINPINLGFARIDSIGLSYQSNQPNPEDNGVMVTLNGTFFWQSDPSKPITWDASKPEQTPAPSGNGNKYLDLRLLAMGQHVTFEGFKTANTVKEAIACMAKMPDPEPGKIPAIEFDPESLWLFGADFGILKLQDSENGDNNALVPRDQAQKVAEYFLNLQVVFNDPYLYAIRIALDGKPAKIFKGLDFQIMYRQISDTVGVYQSEITLPDIMRHLSIGAYSITLPVFSIAIYTNGDFQVDVGFPWNQDFSRSFTIEAIIPPGIPLIGSAGFYFGKLSSATSNKVPAVTNGTFNPVLVFGLGMQVGFGKSVEYGILSAGFSLTVVGIIEGVIAKWNPYQITDGSDDPSQIQDSYYYWLRGTLGIIGKLYGSVDFGIIKADVNVDIKLLLQITYESYVSLIMSVIASVNVSASVKINLGLFKIKISFSFFMRLKESFTIENSGTPPWQVKNNYAESLLNSPADRRLSVHRAMNIYEILPEPKWENLKAPVQPEVLTGYLAPALTIAQDEWLNSQDTKNQLPCYVAMLFIDSVPSADQDSHTSLLKAIGQANDSPFEILSKMVLRLAIAAVQEKPMSADEVDQLVVRDIDLTNLLNNILTSTNDNPTPIPLTAIDSFLSQQFQLIIQLPPDKNAEVDTTYFPMAANLRINIPKYGESYPGYSYSFADYNGIDTTALKDLREYFDQLAVQVQQEMGEQKYEMLAENNAQSLSMAGWILSDYFLLIARQMVQAAREALRDFKYLVQSGQTANQIVQWVNDNGGLTGDHAYSLSDLFIANPNHVLSKGKNITIRNACYQTQVLDTFDSIADMKVYANGFTSAQLASQSENAADVNLLRAGAKIIYSGKEPYIVKTSDSLDSIAKVLNVSLLDLINNSNLLSLEGVLMPSVTLKIPEFIYCTQEGDTLLAISSCYDITLQDLAGERINGDIPDLFSSSKNNCIDIPHLVQFKVKELIAEVQRSFGIQHLSGMASRYYLHGMRLPTKGITPKKFGMWVKDDGGVLKLPAEAGLYALTGQQIPLPTNIQGTDFTITLDRSEGPAWLLFKTNNQPTDQLSISIKPDSDDTKRIKAVTDYAQSNPLDTGLLQLGAEPMYQDDFVSFPLTSMVAWQSADTVQLPYGNPPAAIPSLKLWKLPDAMRNLPDLSTRAVNPKFKIQLAHYDEAASAMVKTPITYYGWASTIAFTVKKIPQVSTSPTTKSSYEIVGAGGNDIVLMERLLGEIRGNDFIFSNILLAYPPNKAGNSPEGVQTDSAKAVTMGISQVNLSTETRPPVNGRDMLFALDEEASPQGLLNKPSEFIRLLWEASITRSGGFYLYYYNADQKCGLPDRVFNDKGEAELTLIVLYNKDSVESEQNRLTSYMNAVAIGENIDTSRAVIFAQADLQITELSVTGDESLASLAYSYYSNVSDLTQKNENIILSKGKKLIVKEGVYQVSPQGIGPGGNLSLIASYFGTTEQAIKEANPRCTKWLNPLPPYTAIRLPKIEVTIGSSPGGNTLNSIAKYYAENMTALAAHNQDIEGLFAIGQQIIIPEGSTVRSATVSPGVVAVSASRSVPAETPDDPSAQDFARTFLLNNYSLLNYRVVDNADFISSNMGLPAGPTTEPVDPENSGKIMIPKTLAANDTWNYKQALPYPKFAKVSRQLEDDLPDSTQSPYIGIGYLLQVNFEWQDLYGNTLVTSLSSPQKDHTGPLNQSPILLGYTDSIIGPAQWPSVSMGWQVILEKNRGTPKLQLQFSFDISRYDESKTESWQENAHKDLQLYTRLYYQLNDPNGIAYTIETTLLRSSKSFDSKGLLDWLFYGNSIYKFLKDRAIGGTSVPAPLANNLIDQQIDLSQVNENQIFELSLAFRIERIGGVVLGDFETTPGVKQTTTVVAPLTQKFDDNNTLGLTQFAQNFQDALSKPGVFLLKVATGVNRTRISTAQKGSTLWAVRLAIGSDQGISYTINNPAAPAIFAPRPISNKLESRNNVFIYDYTTGKGISPNPSRELKFVDIDMDLWGKQFFSAIDNVLKPELTAAIQIVDKLKNKDYLKQILDQKKVLASIIKKWMVAVYEDDNTDSVNVQEVFYQQLLSQLSNAYTTRAAIQFDAKVKADKMKDTGDYKTPRLFGNVVQKTDTDSTNDSEGNDKTDSSLSLTSPKLKLENGTNQPIPFLLTAPEMVRNGEGAVLPNIKLNLVLDGTNIEHQIGQVPGIEGYEASSWLNFIIQEEKNPLLADLGGFEVPLVLRSYPTSPTITSQLGGAAKPDAAELNELTLWDYSFTYGLPFHYPQDRVYCDVDFNIAEAMRALNGIADAFSQLAQFITVFPSVKKDIEEILAGIDATTTDKTCIDNAAVALESFIKIVNDVSNASEDKGFTMLEHFRRFTGTSVPSYNFSIQEKTAQIEGIDALLVIIHGKPPYGIDSPKVLVEPENYEIQSYSGACEGDYCYWYKNKSNDKPLSAAKGQMITGRTVLLTGMDILQRQDAWATVFVRRNEELVSGKKIDSSFVYTSPDVQFSNPLHPTIDTSKEIDISKIGSTENKAITRSLEAHLQALFTALFKNNGESELTFQVEVTYDYAINKDLSAITLPVLMQAPLSFNVKGPRDGDRNLGQMISDWTSSIELWFNTHKPLGTSGILSFNLSIMSNLTKQPMPLIRLRKLYLPIQYIQPLLSTM